MNCCDEFGNCNQGRNCPVRARHHPFAPGVIEGPHGTAQAFDEEVPLYSPLDVVLIIFLVLLLAGVGGFLAGLLA